MKVDFKKELKILSKYFFVFIILMCIYLILMTITSIIPSSILEEQVRESSETLYREGERRKFDLKYKEEEIFNFTDALIINTAYSIDSTNPIESFLLARKNYIPGQTKEVYPDSQYNLGASSEYINKKNGDLYQTKELYGLMNGADITQSFEYARYWHGYLVVLRPLLTLFNYEEIRVVLFIITAILITVMLVLINKKIDLKTALIYGIGLFSICILTVSQSINEILIYFVAFIGTIILLLRKEKIKNIGIFFFIVGSISSFIDLLTAPLVTLGFTAITYFLLLQSQEKMSIKQYIIEILKVCISWGMGYGITWVSKWVIVQVIYNRPLISQSIEQILFRTNLPSKLTNAYKFGNLQVISRNLDVLSEPVIVVISSIGILYIIVKMIQNYKKEIDFKENIKNCVPYIFTFFLPIMWYIVTKQHSYTHAFFAYRNLVISIISILIIATKILKEKEIEAKK